MRIKNVRINDALPPSLFHRLQDNVGSILLLTIETQIELKAKISRWGTQMFRLAY
jgi:hypothetical protein